MNNILFHKRVSGLLSIAALAALSNGLPAIAQTANSTDTQEFTQFSGTETSLEEASFAAMSGENPANVSNYTENQEPFEAIARPESVSPAFTPVPSTTITSSTALSPQLQQPTLQPSATQVAQADIDFGSPFRRSVSYVGIAANIGLAGESSSLSDANFMAIGKVGLSNTISVRPSAVIGDETTILVPVTYDFSYQRLSDPFSEPLGIIPYVGGGAAFTTGDDSDFSFMLTGGIDVPLNRQFTATAAVNAAFFDKTDVGLTIGVGYNFGF
ncbi:MAG: hypothetical protein N2235_01255 [Fischerella sp.]|nr:hypothetical protein [Fischerella sp.]